MSESFYDAEVSPVHKMTFSEEFNSSLTIKSPLSPYGYTGCLKRSKSNGIANRLSNVFFMVFSCVVTVSAVSSVFFTPTVSLTLWPTVSLEVASLQDLFRSGKDPCMCHKCLSYTSCQFLLNQASTPSFFTSALPTLLTTLRALSLDSMSRLNVILTVFGIIA